jgi:hypothetical protein
MTPPEEQLLPEVDRERIRNDPEERMRWTIEQLDGDAERHSPYLVFCALVQKDLEGLERMLAKHPEDAAFAILMYARRTFPKRGSGRPQRKSTAADFMRIINLWLAANDVHRIGVLWKQRLGEKKRNPKCYDIAAKRRGLLPNQVKVHFEKNQYRYRNKSEFTLEAFLRQNPEY